MPTIKRIGPYVFFFYSSDQDEPRHVHVRHKGHGEAKFWLEPVELARNTGFSGGELRKVEKLVTENAGKFIESWDSYFEGA